MALRTGSAFFSRCRLAALLLLAAAPAARAADPRSGQLLAWIEANSDRRTGLPRSHVGDPRLENWTFTYDAASTALAYLAMDKPASARRILDYYIRTSRVFRLGGVIEAVNPKSFAVGEDYGVRSGSNVWLGIAAYHLFRATKEAKYLRVAKLQADFAISLQVSDQKDPNFGAVRMGPKGGGQTPGDQHINLDERLPALFDIMSTENNLDAYALFGMIAREAPARVTAYREAQARVEKWLFNVAYNRELGRFNRGAKDEPDEIMATDVQTWALSALGRDALERLAAGAPDAILAIVEKECVVRVRHAPPDGPPAWVLGADFIDAGGARDAGRPRIVSPEWTFQLVNAYARVAQGKNRERYLSRRAELIEGVFHAARPVDGGLGFPYATRGDTPTGHGWNTPSAGTLSVVGAAWGIFALEGFDPLVVPD